MIHAFCLTVAVLGGAPQVLQAAVQSAVETAIRELVTKVVGTAEEPYELAVLDAAVLVEDDELRRQLAPLYAAIDRELGALDVLTLVDREQIHQQVEKQRAEGESKGMSAFIAMAKALGADGLLYLPVTVQEETVTVQAVWLDARIGEPVAVKRLAFTKEELLINEPVAVESASREPTAPGPAPAVAEKGALSVAAEAAASAKTILALDVRLVGVEETAVATITAQIAIGVALATGLKVLTLADVKDMAALEKTRQVMGCEEDVACLAEISRAVNAELVLSSTLGKVGKSYVITLALVDATKANPVGRASEVVDDLATLPDVLPQAIAQLFGTAGANVTAQYRLPEGRELSFAVFDLKPSGVSAETAQNLTQILSVEIKRVEGTSVIGRDDVMAMLQLEKDKTMLGCIDDISCVAEIGGALGVEKLVVGDVGKLAETYVISLRLIDAHVVKVDNRVNESLKGLQDQLIPAVRYAVRRLLGLVEADAPGVLSLTSNEPEGTVFLDDKEVGELPIRALDGLTPGRHSLRVSKDDFHDWRTDFYVEAGKVTPLWAELKAIPISWYERWWVWVTVGVVAAVGVGLGVGLYLDSANKFPPTDYGPQPW